MQGVPTGWHHLPGSTTGGAAARLIPSSPTGVCLCTLPGSCSAFLVLIQTGESQVCLQAGFPVATSPAVSRGSMSHLA